MPSSPHGGGDLRPPPPPAYRHARTRRVGTWRGRVHPTQGV